ncbi:MAG: 16S rRNA (uracil(1498)-N(3))-methyltransferase [Deltaproteobacteria bacterium]|nr:16S rRNA (uracil(1498)-N(3))-methyltransferase [Deltaproteobacteria bacterium]
MKPRRFKVNQEGVHGLEAVIDDRGEMRHIRQVLRLKVGDAVVLFDGAGKEYPAVISHIAADKIFFKLFTGISLSTAESPLKIILGVGLLKAAKFDWLMQKITELGVAEIIPFASEHVVPQWEGEKNRSRKLRWEKIVSESAKQCQRTTVPRIHFPCSFADALNKEFEKTLKFFLWEREKTGTLLDSCGEAASSIYVLVGPEGGFSEQEALRAQQAGFRPIRLGPRILRAETAGVAIVCLLQFLLGDLN